MVAVLGLFVAAAWLGLAAFESRESHQDGASRSAGGPGAGTSAVSSPRVPDDRARWIGVLRHLDVRRERAWRSGRPGLLLGVFAPGSRPLAADARALHAYRERGLAVDGARMRFWDPRVVAVAADSVRLRVSDRLGPARVLRSGRATPLPRDRPSRHEVTLVDTSAGWRIAAVRAE